MGILTDTEIWQSDNLFGEETEFTPDLRSDFTLDELMKLSEAYEQRNARLPELPAKWRRENYKLSDFVKDAWHVINPYTELVWGWYLDAVCDHLDAVLSGKIRNLLINLPPRTGKSLITVVFFPAYVWIEEPWEKFLCTSYVESRVLDDSGKCIDLITSDWYRSHFGDRVKLKGSKQLKSRFYTTQGGHRIAAPVAGSSTGFGGGIILVDDPHNAKEEGSESRVKIQQCKDWWNSIMPSRGDDLRTVRRVVCGQRIAADDLSQDIIDKGYYDQLIIPMEYEPPSENMPRTMTAKLMTQKAIKQMARPCESSPQGCHNVATSVLMA